MPKSMTPGQWAKVGRKGGKAVYQHVTGATVSYDCNRWVWTITLADGTKGHSYGTQQVAVYEVERAAA